MTRVHAAHRLLEHGPLTFSELCTITGWSWAQVWSAITCLDKSGRLQVSGSIRKRVYGLA